MLFPIVLLSLSSIVACSKLLYQKKIIEYFKFTYNYIKYNLNNIFDINVASIVKINQNEYDIYYHLENKDYIRKIKVNRNPYNFTSAIADNESDVTDIILKYCGAEKSLKNHELTPGDLGYNSITIFYIDNSFKIFYQNDLLSIGE